MLEPDWDRPEPPGAKPVRGLPTVRFAVTLILVLALGIAAFFAPIPVFFAYLPGPVRDVEDLVEVEDTRTYSSEGSLLLTTVSVDPQVTFVDMLQSQFDDTTAIVLKEDVTQGRSLEDLVDAQRREMELSKQHAQEVALTALGFARPEGDGARIQRTLERAPAADVLQPGDVIVGIDGESVETVCDVGRAIDRHEIGETVEIVVRRDGGEETFRVETAENPQESGAPFIGVLMENVGYDFDPGLSVRFETGKIGGPSGGLMMTLALYDRLTPEDLTGGRKVAGTGTIACDGGVGAIGGIEQKVAAAEREGATVFLSPVENAAAARRVAEDIEIVEVSTFDDAVNYLEGLG